MDPRSIKIEDYTYHLPADKIAEFPLAERDQSRLLHYEGRKIEDRTFSDITSLIPSNSLLVLNNTRVIEARLLFRKPTGAQVELFCLEPQGQPVEQALQSRSAVVWKCMIGGASKWKPGQLLQKEVSAGATVVLLTAKYLSKEEDSFLIEFSWTNNSQFAEVLHEAGAIPLPPYIKRSAQQLDSQRYQTVFGIQEGSVAAPTAALHFTDQLLQEIKTKAKVDFITLHVGAGTFKPVKTETIADHRMHAEPFTVHRRLVEQLISSDYTIAVGTTSLRSLESLYWLGVKLRCGELNDWSLGQWEAYDLGKHEVPVKESLTVVRNWMIEHDAAELHCSTSLIIVPGYHIKIPSALITNFHQPQSTLLLLVAAFVGEDWRKIYDHALQQNYRFLSYGDSSFLQRAPRLF